MTGPVDQGQTYRYRHSITDSAGVPTNAGTVTVTITLPDGTTTAPTILNSSAGVYDISYTTTQVGLHNVKGSATGGVLAAEFDVWEDNFTVEQPGRTFISVDEASNHLNAAGIITTVAQREQLRWLCMVASDAVERDLGRVIARRTVVETYDGGSCGISLRSTPVISITTVVESGTTLTGTDYLLNVTQGVLLRGSTNSSLSWASGWQNIVVTHVAGYANPPRVARKVALNIVQAMWQSSQQASHPFLDELESRGFDSVPMSLESLSPVELRAYERLRAHGVA